MAQQKSRIDVHQIVTDKIVAAIEAGVDTWQMPWHRPGTSFSIPKNARTDKRYRGINILSLWIDADTKKFEHSVWATYKQWQELGAQVRAGEKSSLIVKYGEWSPKDAEPDDNGEAPTRMYAKPAWVFNVAQVDCYEIPALAPRQDLTSRLAHVDRFLENTRAQFHHGGQSAFYRHLSSDGSGDYIQLPERDMFTGTPTSTPTESYEATRLHEALHWTSAKSRCDRELGMRYGDEAYSFEEIVAEIGAAALCAHLDISNTPRPDHAQYVDHWLTILKGNKKAIFTASSLASKAVDFLFALQPAIEGGVL